MRRVQTAAVAAAIAAAVACSSEAEPSPASAAGAGSGVGGSGGIATQGGDPPAAGSGASGEAGAGNGGDGGSSGSGGTAGSPAAMDVSLEDVDLALGGFNQDLPAPSVECLDKQVSIGCFAVSGEYNGEPFEMICDDDRTTLSGIGGGYIEGCYNSEVDGQRFDVEVILAAKLVATPPSTFGADAATADAFPNLFRPDRELDLYNGRDFSMYQLAATHDLDFHVAGISHVVTHPPPAGHLTSVTKWQIEGTFGLSITPKSDCVPDAMGFGCDAMRMRGAFNVSPPMKPPTP